MKSALVAFIWLAVPAIALLLALDGEIDGRVQVEPAATVNDSANTEISAVTAPAEGQ